MGRRRGRGAKARAKRKAILVGGGIALALMSLIFFLGCIVVMKNKSDCDEIGVGAGLAGCKAKKEYSFDQLYFVVGNTANTPKPIIADKTALKEIIANSYVDGCPDIQLTSVSREKKKIKYDNSECKERDNATDKVKKRVQAQIEKLEEALSSKPESDGAEYLETIYSVANKIQGKNSNEKALLIVIGSGLSDGGKLNFSEAGSELLDANSESVLQEFEDKHAISEDRLSGVTIFWYGIGAVSPPQHSLEQSQKENLQEIYRTILEEQGAKMFRHPPFENIDDSDSIETDKEVKTTPISAVECIFCNGGKEFYSDTIGFVENSTEFTEETRGRANEILSQVHDEMSKNSSERLKITAYRASDTSECTEGYYRRNSDYHIDIDRANRIRDLLISRGIDGARIEATGEGVPNDDCSGEEARKLNRKVKIQAIRE